MSNPNQEVLVKFDANGYPESTALPDYFDVEIMGPFEDYTLSTLAEVNLAAETNEPAQVVE